MSNVDPTVSDPPDPGITLPPVNPPPAAPTTRRPPQTFTAEDVERIRQEEKDKLYARLGKVEDLEKTVAEMQAERAEAEKARKSAEKEAEVARKAKENEELSAKDLLAKAQQEWEAKLREESEKRERMEIILQKEREIGDLQRYLSQQMVAVADGTEEFPQGIMPQLRDFVGGNTKEEIDASILAVQERTASILGEFTARQNGQRAQQPTSRVTSPPVGPMELVEDGTKSFSLQELKDMPAGEYQKYRERLTKEASRQYYNR